MFHVHPHALILMLFLNLMTALKLYCAIQLRTYQLPYLMFVSICKVQRLLIEGGARLISYSQSLQGSQPKERAILQPQDLVVTQNPTRSQETIWLIEHDNSTDLKHIIIVSDCSVKY